MINIEIFKSEDKQTNLTDARELHAELESKRDFSNWIKNKVVNNPFFIKDEDFAIYNKFVDSDTQQVKVGKPQINYALTLDTAKKIAMAEQTKVGNEIRDYFIRRDKELTNVITHNQNILSDTFIKRIKGGERKIVLAFLRSSLDDGGINTVMDNINYISNSKKLKGDNKAYVLEQFRVTFPKLIAAQDGMFGADNAAQIKSIEASVEGYNREFSRRSASHKATIFKKDIIKLREDKIYIQKESDNKIRKYVGTFVCEEDEESGGRVFLVDNDDIEMVVSPMSFTKEDGEVVPWTSGDIHVKADNLYLDVTAGPDALILRTKALDLGRLEYTTYVELSLATFTYIVLITKVK